MTGCGRNDPFTEINPIDGDAGGAQAGFVVAEKGEDRLHLSREKEQLVLKDITRKLRGLIV